MNKRQIIAVLTLLYLITSCRPDPKMPQWDVEALTPLANSRVEIGDIVADSNLTSSPDGLISLVFMNRLAEFQPDEIITPLNAEFTNTVNLQSIDLGSPNVTDFVSLGELAKGGTPSGQFIINNHGNVSTVPNIPNSGPKSFNVDATDLFQTITLIDGDLDLTITNEFPVPLTDIEFRLENSISGNIIMQSNIDTLHPQETVSQNYSLANTTIEGQLKAVLQKFSSPGSTTPVLIDTSDRIVVTIKLSNLNPSSATAIFPDQDLASDTADTESLKAGNALLTSILVDQGKIYLDATSTIEDIINLDYEVPSATLNSQSLNFMEKIPAAPPGGSSNLVTELDVAGYTVDLTGRPWETGIYNRFYTILTAGIDSSGRLINLSLDDSVLLKTGISDLRASRGYGYLGEDTIDDSETNFIDIFSVIDSGNFDLEDARLTVGIENFIGAPIDVRLNWLQSRKGTAVKDLNWTQLGQNITIPAAGYNEPVPIVSYQEFQINSGNSNLDELIELQPESMFTSISAFINGSTPAPDFNQFIFLDYGVRATLNLEVPLHLAASGLRVSDTGSFNYSGIDADKQLQSGILKLIANNFFPLGATVDILLLDQNNDQIGKLTSAEVVDPAELDANGRPVSPVKSIVEYPLTESEIALLQRTNNVVFRVSFTSPVPPDKVKIYSDNFMDLTLAGDLTVRTK